MVGSIHIQVSGMPDIDFIRSEIERVRIKVYRQRGQFRQFQRAGIPTDSAEALLDRMLNKIDRLFWAELDPSRTWTTRTRRTGRATDHLSP
jgi:hypothetical protein